MVFSSMVFLWIFLPVVFVLSRIFRSNRAQNILLLIASLIFYAWGEPRYIFLLLVSIFMNWIFGLLIDRYRSKDKLFLTLDVIANLALLGYFKYADFAINTVNRLFGASIPAANIALPVGISFFTFQAMSYVIDLYRGQYKVQKNLLSLALYVSFFPQLIAGPIVLYKDINEQIEHREITKQKTTEGIRRFLYGLGKKVILSNLIAVAVDNLFGLDYTTLSGAQAWVAAIGYTLQIYYDFSGYSDMAIGLGKMFGFEFLENFTLPYQSASITEFWRRWHISLGMWFRNYVYIPLGGNRKGKKRTYLNLFIVFALTGLWHGAAWTFVFWGLFHGFFIIIERMGFKNVLEKVPVLAHIYTMLVVIVGWVFFRADSGHQAFAILKRMFLFWKYPSTEALSLSVGTLPAIAIVLGILGCGVIQAIAAAPVWKEKALRFKMSVPEAAFLSLVLVYSILLLANNTYNPFIYYKF